MQLFVVHVKLDLTGCPIFVFARSGNHPYASSLGGGGGWGEATLVSCALAKGVRVKAAGLLLLSYVRRIWECRKV